jgi:hypothetical protein
MKDAGSPAKASYTLGWGAGLNLRPIGSDTDSVKVNHDVSGYTVLAALGIAGLLAARHLGLL